MLNRIQKISFFLLLCVASCRLSAQSHRFFTQEDGLSSNRVRKIAQDSRGFIWLATVDGLNRFDGYQFKVFKHDLDDSTSISNNNLYDLCFDRDGNLWVASLKGGLNLFNPETETFRHFRFDPEDSTSVSSDEIISVFEDSQGSIWVGTAKGLNRVVKDSVSGQIYFKRYNTEEDDPGGKIRSVLTINEDNRGYLWLGTSVGLIRFHPPTESFINYNYEPGLTSFAANGFANDIVKDASGNLWVGYQPGGLQKVEITPVDQSDSLTVQFTTFYPKPYPQNINANRINALHLDRNDRLWMGTLEGIFQLPIRDSSFAFSTFNLNAFKELPSPRLAFNDFFNDAAENIWIATQLGLLMIPAHQHPFRVLTHQPDNSQGLPSNIIYATIKDSSEQLWVSTDKGLAKINQKTGDISVFTAPDALSGNKVKGMALDSKGRLYLADYGSIIRVDNSDQPKFKKFTYRLDEMITQLHTRRTFHAFVDEGDVPWIAAYWGIFSIDIAADTLIPIPFDQANHFNQIIAKGRDSLWMGSQLGLFSFDKKTRTYHQENLGIKHKNEVIKHIQPSRDSSFTLWLGTQTGLHKFVEGKGIIQSYTEKDGLHNAFVQGFIEDDLGIIWLETEKGLARFDPQSETFSAFHVEDGLPSETFETRSAFKDENGILYFGTDKGLLYFDPAKVKPNPFIPPVQITELRLFNDPVLINRMDPRVSSHTFSLAKTISSTRKITLNHNQRVISFGFSALNYHLPQNNQYAYQLEGFDEEWIYTHASQRQATYTNLDPGVYTFRVKASNNDQVWNDQGTTIELEILPPWYRTWWAYVLYLILAAFLIWTYIRYRTEAIRREMRTQQRIEKAKIAEREKVRARSSRDFHDEAGNKITKISLYTGLLKQQHTDDPKMLEFLTRIEDNVKELSSGMRDFIWVLDPKQDSLLATILRIKQFGDSLFEHSGIDFQFENRLPENPSYTLDLNTRRHLLMIFKEAMNNSLKYSEASEVRFITYLGEEGFTIKLTDNGLGFDPKNLARVNGLENMKSRAEESGATLTIEGVPGLGTRVIFHQKMPQKGN
jgi:ligand-binding sensor domain-containing protein/signal transduction histidine kinase